jgi:hypothetical protein
MEQTKNNLCLTFRLEYNCVHQQPNADTSSELPKDSLLMSIIRIPDDVSEKQINDGLTIVTDIGIFNGMRIDNEFINLTNDQIKIQIHTCDDCMVTLEEVCPIEWDICSFENARMGPLLKKDIDKWFDDVCGNIQVELLRGG